MMREEIIKIFIDLYGGEQVDSLKSLPVLV